jgi:topoisomerase-4 subunit A
MVASTTGRFYTLAADKLPGGRGHGEPIKLMLDMEAAEDVVTVFVHNPERKLLVISTEGRGFVVPEAEVVANTRKGKAVLGVDPPNEMRVCVAAAGDTVAVLGDNRKMVLFPLSQVPEMSRGKGVRLQRYKDGGIADARVFVKSVGLSWVDSSGRSFNRPSSEIKEWFGDRAQAGRISPTGFPRTNRFGTDPFA